LNAIRWLFRLALGRRLPITDGVLSLTGPNHPITIRRDRWGVPTIDAQSDFDAWFGVGFCHGQDRAFQLESILRVIHGTLAEVVGAAGLPIDRLARRIGFARSAQAQLPVLAADIRSMLEAYAAGVTAGATLGAHKHAHEFALLRSRPTPWTAADILGYLKLQAFALVSNWDVELARFKVLTADGPEALKALDASYPDWHPVTDPPETQAGPLADRISADIAAFSEIVKLGGGSNNWALAAGRTRTGRPILANDPHLPGTLPSHWYLAHVRTPEWQVAGASFVGGPIFPSAHNGHGAWGVTVGLIDDTDLFLEEVTPEGQMIRQGDDFVPCKTWVESIAVKGVGVHEERVVQTPRGPIISSLSTVGEDKPLATPHGSHFTLEGVGGIYAFSLRATWLEAVPVRGLLSAPRARSFEEFRRNFAQWPGLSLNMVYADASGAIGWHLAGMAPRRKKGHGTIPLPGWDEAAGWEAEPVPFDQMPHAANPSNGFLATANNKPAADGGGPFLSTDYADGYRILAIIEALGARTDWDVPSCQALQKGVQSLAWREMREVVLACKPKDADALTALEMLRKWDGAVAAESAGAAVYEVFIAEMVVRVAKAKAPRCFEWIIGRGASAVTADGFFAVRRTAHFVRLLREQPAGWFARSWPEEMADALTAAMQRLRSALGRDPLRWSWGRFRSLTLRHPLGARKPFNHVFNLGPYPFGGDATTIAQASVKPLHPMGDPGFMASLRMVVDVGNWSASRFALPGGQSGNPCSPHYADQVPVWMNNEGIPIAWTEEDVERSTRATLRLNPVER
jgi:penicillin amidase